MLTFSTFMKTTKRYAANPSIGAVPFVNAMLEPYLAATGALARGGKPLYLNDGRVSKLLSGEEDVPVALRKVINRRGLEAQLTQECRTLFYDLLNSLSVTSMEQDLLDLFDKRDPLQMEQYELLSEAQDNAELFLARAMMCAFKASNKTKTETVLWRSGAGSFCWIEGDLFRYGFGNRKRTKNLLVIPVDCAFTMHITWLSEIRETQKVSASSIHGQWINRMVKSGISEEELKTRATSNLSATLPESYDDDIPCYPVGTIAVIDTERATWLLLAISHLGSDGRAVSTKQDITSALHQLLDFYDCSGQGESLYLPLIGSGMSRVFASSLESWEAIRSAVLIEPRRITGKITLVVSPDDAAEIRAATASASR